MRTLLLKITLGLIFFVGTSLTALAQPMINTQDVSNPNSCDGAAWFSDSTMNSTTIFWQGNGTVLQQGGYGITGLCAGTYTVTYQDAGGNNITLTFIISATNDPCAGFYTVGQSTDVSAAGMCDGTAWMTTTGGTAPYTFLWSDPNQQSDSLAVYLTQGWYNVTVTDANGCEISDSVYMGILENGEMKLTDLWIYPVPASQWIHINQPIEHWGIYDAAGRALSFGESKDIDVHELPDAVYLIDCYVQGELYRLRFIKSGFGE